MSSDEVVYIRGHKSTNKVKFWTRHKVDLDTRTWCGCKTTIINSEPGATKLNGTITNCKRCFNG